MTKQLAYSLMAIGVLFIVVGIITHFLLRVELVPHFAIYLGVLGVVAAGSGVYGITGARKAG